MSVPPILLEGDVSPAPAASGLGQRYSLGPPPSEPEKPKAAPLVELPVSYGTERLFLVARDPHWVYATWDLSPEQQRRLNALTAEGHLSLRIYENSAEGRLIIETALHPDSRSWFVNVGHGGTRCLAQLGYWSREGTWNVISTSALTLTPPETLSKETVVEFATIPPQVSLKTLFQVVQEAVTEHPPLREVVQELRTEGHPELPPAPPPEPNQWTPAQTQALAEVVRMDDSRRVWVGALEITEVIRRHLQEEITSAVQPPGVPPPGAALGPGGVPISAVPFSGLMPHVPAEALGVSSAEAAPVLPGAAPSAFWFNVNAELVVYGATEPEAKVVIGGRAIRLRPDGTFSFRFALPDGNYPLKITAQSPDGTDLRSVNLQFSRSTDYQGDVGQHPQEPTLKPPRPENLS